MTLLAFAPLALVRADARPPALLASAPAALVRADARPPALLAFAPLASIFLPDLLLPGSFLWRLTNGNYLHELNQKLFSFHA